MMAILTNYPSLLQSLKISGGEYTEKLVLIGHGFLKTCKYQTGQSVFNTAYAKANIPRNITAV